MDGRWGAIFFSSIVYAWCFMIVFKILLFLVSSLFLIAGIVTIVSPDVNNIFLPIETDGLQEAHFARSFAGLITSIGYLSMRSLYSSSKVQVGSVVLIIIFFTIISKIFSFIYDGISTLSFSTFVIGIIFAISLYIVQKSKKNELDYNL